MKVTLGGDRLGSGSKMQVDLHGYGRSTHDKSRIWRSTMASGTLVPFMTEVTLPGDTFDVALDCDVKTHPTIGPLFGSYKVQLDLFWAPVRLYQAWLHNNKLNIGRKMSDVKLPLMRLKAFQARGTDDISNAQINPSCILHYLGITGVGWINAAATATATRDFCAVPLLMYWDTYKNYYANKQEEIGAVISGERPEVEDVIAGIQVGGELLPEAPTETPIATSGDTTIEISYGPTAPDLRTVIFNTTGSWIGSRLNFMDIVYPDTIVDNGTDTITATINGFLFPEGLTFLNWDYISETDIVPGPPTVETFPLENIDLMREYLLEQAGIGATPVIINDANLSPYEWVIEQGDTNNMLNTQEGLGVKTYQSDLFNNWLNTEWIDDINERTSVDTSGGSFTMDALLIARKVYDQLNRISVGGGSYDDWIMAVYATESWSRCEIPVYQGGLIKELVFQEVVSNSQSTGENGGQPLGTLAGKGVLSRKHKGGRAVIRTNEIGFIMGIVSLTPRVDYSQGNKWHVHLKTMNDFHQPGMDEIGFQDLVEEQMGWWSTGYNGTTWVQKAVGKQPAWLNYMTDVNETHGNFAINGNEMFMTLNRRYESRLNPDSDDDNFIADMTTYVDPRKFNEIFAETAIDAQNFWVQIAVNVTARRVMSAKIMPNL